MSSEKIELRQASENDLSNVLGLFERSVREICGKDYTLAQINAWISTSLNRKEVWRKKLEAQYFLVAERDGAMTGFGSLEHNYIDFMYVSADHQNKGVARIIYTALEEEAVKNQVDALYSDVSKTARSFFEQRGFKVVHANNNMLGTENLINFRMVKKL